MIYSNYIPTLLHYFSCLSQVLTKYRLYFKLSKYDFFLSRIKYVGHDLIADGSFSAQFKFDRINKWPLPLDGMSFLFYWLVFILQQLWSMARIKYQTSSSSSSFVSSSNSITTCLVTSANWRFLTMEDEYNNFISSPSIR